MSRRILIDAGHPEDTRVVLVNENRLEEFDHERRDNKPLKGNIYLAKVTRVEPSLQAAFVDYGGNRHGFLPFSEIHPDYYRLPVADREALVAEERAAQQKRAEAEKRGESEDGGDGPGEPDGAPRASGGETTVQGGSGDEPSVEEVETTTSVETISDDDVEDAARRRAAMLGRYKIQEVIKRRQVMLVQVVKEERGTKGAALSTYLSIAGRYCVLMPNTDRGGGVSRKIASAKDRKRLKQVLSTLNIPEGMSVIVRTAGSDRSKVEIRRDYEHLLRLWDHIRDKTLQSVAPCLIYEEANLVKRTIRDLYTRDMDRILVEGDEGYRAAKSFMRSLIPSHAKKVQKHDDPRVPLFHSYGVETQLDNIHNPAVQLQSGGYVIINQTEALVAIDVNSGKATKERHIEETALKTNLEAADEIARQLKLRDLAGLIVIDFIDMDVTRNNREVEQRLKEAMKQDRARIQLGRISPFGLLELSRQRLRPSLHETSTDVCKTCGGSGFVRSQDSTALHVLRALEEEGIKRGGGEVVLTVPNAIALYVLNDKRDRLIDIEHRYGFRVRVSADGDLVPPQYRLDRLSTEAAAAAPGESADAKHAEAEPESQDESGRKRGKRGGRKKREDSDEQAQPAPAEPSADAGETAEGDESQSATAEQSEENRRRRRGKRGGQRRARRRQEHGEPAVESGGTAEPAAAEASSPTTNGSDGASEPAAEPSATTAAGTTAAAAADDGGAAATSAQASSDGGPKGTSASSSGRRAKRSSGGRSRSRKKTADAAPESTEPAQASAEPAATDGGAQADPTDQSPARAEPGPTEPESAADADTESTGTEAASAAGSASAGGTRSRRSGGNRRGGQQRSRRTRKMGSARESPAPADTTDTTDTAAHANDVAAAGPDGGNAPSQESAPAAAQARGVSADEPSQPVSVETAVESAVQPAESEAVPESAETAAAATSDGGGEADSPSSDTAASGGDSSAQARPRRRGWWRRSGA